MAAQVSERPIAVGDLVQVILPPPCGCPSISLGMIRTVIAFQKSVGVCVDCKDHQMAYRAVLDGPAPWAHWVIQPYRLKRIPPLSELEGERTEENMKEPA